MCAHAKLGWEGQAGRKAPCLVQGSIAKQRVGGGAEGPVEVVQEQLAETTAPGVGCSENSPASGVPESC